MDSNHRTPATTADHRPTCFIAMPISTPDDTIGLFGGDKEHFQHVLRFLFMPAIDAIGYRAIPPMVSGAEIIHASIIRHLETADLVLCDMSLLNANVFFELGIRTAVDKPVALVRDTFTTKVPFDTTLINHHIYSPALAPWLLTDETQRLSDHLRSVVNSSASRNTLWHYFGLKTRAEQQTDGSTDQKLSTIIRLLDQGAAAQNLAPSPNPAAPRGMDAFSSTYAAFAAAQALARTVSAEFAVKSFTADHLVLDLENYMIGEELTDEIYNVGRALGVDISIEGALVNAELSQ